MRVEVSEFDCTVNDTVPLPDPEPAVIDTQAAPVDAVHAHPVCVLTLNWPVPPPAGAVPDVGSIVYVQGGGGGGAAAAAWLTVNVWPPAVIVPLRVEVAEFAWTENAIVADPVPDVDDVTVIHDAPDAVVHEHPEPVVSANEPEPPSAVTSCDVGLIE